MGFGVSRGKRVQERLRAEPSDVRARIPGPIDWITLREGIGTRNSHASESARA